MNNSLFKSINEAIDIIYKSNNIFIASHVNPDGDNIGSSLALVLAIKSIGKNVTVLRTDDIIPRDYAFLPGIDLYRDYSDDLGEIDLFIAVDSSDIDRLGKNKDLINKSKIVINIDHHKSNTNFGSINIVDSKASATAELIYYIIKHMEIEIDRDIATNIYTGISTDTGKFSYESVGSHTHKIAAELLDTGINLKEININLYENSSIESTRLFIEVLGTLKFFSDNKIATAKVSQKMLEETNANLNDTEGIVSFIRSIGPVEVSCILKEIDTGEVKASLRSKEYVDVSSICGKFNGGGHIRAAGCTIYKDLETAESLIVSEITRNIR